MYSDTVGDDIVTDPIDPVFYCWACQHQMMTKDKVEYECPTCHNHHTQKLAF